MYVVDASVYVSRIQQQEMHHADSRRFLEIVTAQELPILCPEILMPEVAAAIARGTDDTDLAQNVAESLRRLSNHRFFAVDESLSALAARLAAERRIRGCDAIYVALAYREGARLITWDAEQRERAAAAVEALTPAEELETLARG